MNLNNQSPLRSLPNGWMQCSTSCHGHQSHGGRHTATTVPCACAAVCAVCDVRCNALWLVMYCLRTWVPAFWFLHARCPGRKGKASKPASSQQHHAQVDNCYLLVGPAKHTDRRGFIALRRTVESPRGWVKSEREKRLPPTEVAMVPQWIKTVARNR